jgi:hypothetical protein
MHQVCFKICSVTLDLAMHDLALTPFAYPNATATLLLTSFCRLGILSGYSSLRVSSVF